VLASCVTDTCRELRIALPSTAGDVYRQHQLVWKAMRATGDRVRDFIYVMLSPHIALVRSRQLSRGSVSDAIEGSLRIRIVSARQAGHGGLESLDVEGTLKLAERLFSAHGFVIDDLHVEDQTRLHGIKVDRSGCRLNIVLPVSDLMFQGRCSNRAGAALAWANGMGRGKRFGCGMLRKAL